VLQLDEISLFASGLALLEQNLHTIDSQGTFEEKVSLSVLSIKYPYFVTQGRDRVKSTSCFDES
jgi:hypothetical protein